MVEPINSKSDDIAYITTTDNNIAYFSSARKGGSGNLDLYKTGKTTNGSPIEEKPVIADNNGNTKDSASQPNGFDEFKKIAKKEKQQETVQPSMVKNSKAKPATESKKTEVTPQKTEEAPVQQPKEAAPEKAVVKTEVQAPKAEPADQKTTEVAVQQAVVTEKAVIKTEAEPVKTEGLTKGTVSTSVQRPSNIPMNQDTSILNASVRGLVFRVQLGAFRNHITVNSPYFEKLNKKLIQEELSEDMLYKYTIGSFESVSRATKAKLILRESGYTGAFLACYYNTKRISMDEAIIMLDKKVYERMAFNQK